MCVQLSFRHLQPCPKRNSNLKKLTQLNSQFLSQVYTIFVFLIKLMAPLLTNCFFFFFKAAIYPQFLPSPLSLSNKQPASASLPIAKLLKSIPFPTPQALHQFTLTDITYSRLQPFHPSSQVLLPYLKGTTPLLPHITSMVSSLLQINPHPTHVVRNVCNNSAHKLNNLGSLFCLYSTIFHCMLQQHKTSVICKIFQVVSCLTHVFLSSYNPCPHPDHRKTSIYP